MGGTLTVNGVIYASSFLVASTTRDLFHVDGTFLYNGDFSQPLDADGYPTVLKTTPSATKQ